MRLTTLMLLALTAVAWADDKPAEERGAKLLKSFTAVQDELCHTTRLGLFVDDNLVGFLRFSLSRADGDPPGYGLQMRAEMRFGSSKLVRSFSGRCDASFRPIEGRGEELRTDGGKTVKTSGSYKRAGTGYAWTGTAADGTTSTKQIAGRVDGFDGLHLVLARRWATLPAEQAHTFSLLSEDDGTIQKVRVTRAASDPIKIDIVEGKGKTKTFTLGKDGVLERVRQSGAPFVMTPISAVQLEAWRQVEPSAPSASTAVGCVALFFARVAGGDVEGLKKICQTKTLIYSATIDALAGQDAEQRAAIKAQLDARWEPDGGAALTRAFFGNMIARAKKSSGGKMPGDAAHYVPFLKRVSRDENSAIVHFLQGKKVALIFDLVRRKDGYLVSGQRKPR